MNNYVIPEVGWLAQQLLPYGHARALALLGLAVTLNDGMASDDEINGMFRDLADSHDPVFDINERYRGLEAAYPYLEGWLGPLTRWTEQPTIEDYHRIPDACRLLGSLAWSVLEQGEGLTMLPAFGKVMEGPTHGAEGDILGQVYADMTAQGVKRQQVFHYTPIRYAMVDFMMEAGPEYVLRMGDFQDAWCGSGVRVIAMARLLRMMGREVGGRKWILNDPNRTAVALAGLNMVAEQIGPDVTLRSDREWAELWAARMGGKSVIVGRHLGKTLPPELAHDVPGLEQ